MRILTSSLLPLSLLMASGAFAEEQPVPEAPSQTEQPPSAASAEPAPDPEPATTPASPANALPSGVSSPPPRLSEPSSEVSLRPVLAHVADQTRLHRYTESALGLAGAGALFGVGFVAEGPDMTWSHALWVTSGIIALGSVANLFIPSELENLERSSSTLSEQELERRWQKLAQKARVARKVEAVFGGLLGVASISLGVLAFEGELGSLTDDERRILAQSWSEEERSASRRALFGGSCRRRSRADLRSRRADRASPWLARPRPTDFT